LYRAIGHQQPMLIVEVAFALSRTLKGTSDKAQVVRMRSLQYQVGRWFRAGRVAVDSSRFLGPEYPPGTSVHCDESGATEPLRVCQIRLAPPKFDFALLAFFDIE